LLRLRNIVGLLLLTSAVISLWLIARNRQPHYLGHPISYWTEPWHHHGQETPEREAAAFAQMDERAVRWLARQLDWRPSKMLEGFAKLMNSVIGDFMPDRDTDSGRREASIRALARLGPRARAAIPALEAVSCTTVQLHRTSVRGEALGALIRVRNEPVTPYIDRLKKAQGEDWTILCYALAAQSTNAAEAAPILADALIRSNAVWWGPTIAALGGIRSHPETSVPALIRCLEITNQIEHQITIDALGKFGPQASAAWPALLTCLSNSDRFISQHLQRALKKIDPQRAAELGF
jgi:hypothetical protein